MRLSSDSPNIKREYEGIPETASLRARAAFACRSLALLRKIIISRTYSSRAHLHTRKTNSSNLNIPSSVSSPLERNLKKTNSVHKF